MAVKHGLRVVAVSWLPGDLYLIYYQHMVGFEEDPEQASRVRKVESVGWTKFGSYLSLHAVAVRAVV